MKRFLTILFTIMFPAFIFGWGYESVDNHIEPITERSEAIADTNRENFIKLADNLKECCFDTPRTLSFNLQCNQQQKTVRYWHDNGKQNPTAIIPEPEGSCQLLHDNYTAVAQTRHKRGYYIYALRHIII